LRIIAISGAHRSAGKTTLARRLKAILDAQSRVLKVGHGKKKNKDEILVHNIKDLADIIGSLQARYVLIESNRVYEVLTPDFSIYIDAVDKPKKKSADLARTHADIVIEEGLDAGQILAVLNKKRFFGQGTIQRLYETITEFYQDYLKRKGIGSPTGIILAGGKGKRLNHRDKALLEFRGQTLLERRVMLLKSLCGEIIVVSNNANAYTGEGFRLVRDKRQSIGPIMGLYTGLINSTTQRCFVTACDMPFINRKLFGCLEHYSESYDAVIPRMGKNVEPLIQKHQHSARPKRDGEASRGFGPTIISSFLPTLPYRWLRL
jgi:molybdopterin-guanine dinucleotide biosynthesis protein A